jgi:hypothetical protein
VQGWLQGAARETVHADDLLAGNHRHDNPVQLLANISSNPNCLQPHPKWLLPNPKWVLSHPDCLLLLPSPLLPDPKVSIAPPLPPITCPSMGGGAGSAPGQGAGCGCCGYSLRNSGSCFWILGRMVRAPYSRLSLAAHTGTTLCASTSASGTSTAAATWPHRSEAHARACSADAHHMRV